MKIRTITTGVSLTDGIETDKIRQAAEFNQQAKEIFQQRGYVVQTTRIATNPWGEYLTLLSPVEAVQNISTIEKYCQELGVNFFNIGPAISPAEIALIPEINKTTSIVYSSCHIGDAVEGINLENALAAAVAIKRMAQETVNGFGNFRFCAAANCPPGIPFFPVSYHQGETMFAIGLECSDLVSQAFAATHNLETAADKLKLVFEEELGKVETIATEIATTHNITYGGIDASVAPSINPTESLAFAYENLGLGKFGHPGTLTISALITGVLKNLSVKTCGYSGLMLPVCEDVGLAQRANESTYNITNLLLYSAVCGCGLDTIPLPGDINEVQIEAILLDIASLAIKLNKPLSARLLLIPGKTAGEMTDFDSPYLVNCKILGVN
ncbi:MAG TPA: DUF711 family protein [Oscillatoriaceae cyanobacterium M33_DOE_052]|uniref:DUF711 family protein n=1 Tax=Planktothricoides sp. SpSt-374 TaxID=2282167 RepID=A0A7C4A009_9CYAN|nr:DUF711 family protein [Oscillatoriaceae cyanobacterium M33_DOE_052]